MRLLGDVETCSSITAGPQKDTFWEGIFWLSDEEY
jgi:hypothetical protein